MLSNVWYMLGWSEEFSLAELVTRRIADHALVVHRTAEGSLSVLMDRCPHRFAPLSLGELTPGGSIRCRYHGLEFGPTGACTLNPHGSGKIPAAARVQSYPIVERHGMAWVWIGQRAPDEALIPDYSAIDEQRCFVARRSMMVGANYQLESDNIMDLSHIQFLHPGTLGSSSVQDGETKVEQEGLTVHSRRFISGERLPPFLEQVFQVPPGTVTDRWLDVRWDPPACMLLTVSIGLAGRPRDEARTVLIPHVFSPKTSSQTYYWYASCFAKTDAPDGQERAERHVTGLTRPFADEDLPMLEAQQAVLGDADFWSLKPVLLVGDAAAVRARRVHDSLSRRSE
jgi:vanillate O-demethylase monooxygenase subunit